MEKILHKEKIKRVYNRVEKILTGKQAAHIAKILSFDYSDTNEDALMDKYGLISFLVEDELASWELSAKTAFILYSYLEKIGLKFLINHIKQTKID